MAKKLWVKWLKRVLWTLGILAILFFLGVVPFALSWLLINGSFRFPDPDAGKTPADFGVTYEEVQFESDPGVRLYGWFLPAQKIQPEVSRALHEAPSGTVILVHGLNRTRAEMLSKAVFLAQNHYNALLFDLRHHGQSDGKISSMGFCESNDIVGAIHFLAAKKKIKDKLALWGVSMGATAALLAAAKEPEVSAVISDSSFLSLEDTVVHHAKVFLGLPRFPIVDEILYITTWRLGFRRQDLDLRKTVREIGSRPILFVAGGADPRMPPEIAKSLYKESSSPRKELLIVEGARHGAAYRTDTKRYQEVVLNFLEKNLTGLTPELN
jgi:pimeloyl-ACP methyl ester carboxylesterase